jgi:cytoskeletal protein RodZ
LLNAERYLRKESEMSTWRTLVVAMVVCLGLWLIGCREEAKQERNTTVDDANVTLAQMRAEQAAAAAREANKPTAGATTPAVPTTNPATPTTPTTPTATPAPATTPPASAPAE